MPRLLPLRGDEEQRLVCSECWQVYGDAIDRTWPFERYRDAGGEQVSALDIFEIRRGGDGVEWRLLGVGGPGAWQPFPGGTIYCKGEPCRVVHIGNYRVYDPTTGELGAP